MTVTSRPFRPSQCSSCRESSWLLLKTLALVLGSCSSSLGLRSMSTVWRLTSSPGLAYARACLDRSHFLRLGLLEGEATDWVKTTFFTFLDWPLKPLSPRLEVDGGEAAETRDVGARETLGGSPSAHQAGA